MPHTTLQAVRLTNRFYAEIRDDELLKYIPEAHIDLWVERMVDTKLENNPTKRERD